MYVVCNMNVSRCTCVKIATDCLASHCEREREKIAREHQIERERDSAPKFLLVSHFPVLRIATQKLNAPSKRRCFCTQSACSRVLCGSKAEGTRTICSNFGVWRFVAFAVNEPVDSVIERTVAPSAPVRLDVQRRVPRRAAEEAAATVVS